MARAAFAIRIGIRGIAGSVFCCSPQHLWSKVLVMASSSDEVSFLEQQLLLLNRGALDEARQMVSIRLQHLKSEFVPKQFDLKVCMCVYADNIYACTSLPGIVSLNRS